MEMTMIIYKVLQALGFAVFALALVVSGDVRGIPRYLIVLGGFVAGFFSSYIIPNKAWEMLAMVLSYLGLIVIFVNKDNVPKLIQKTSFPPVCSAIIPVLAALVPFFILGYIYRGNSFISLIFGISAMASLIIGMFVYLHLRNQAG